MAKASQRTFRRKPSGVYTTGDVAAACAVSCKMAIKWADSGAIQSYRVPGSLDRRFTEKALIAFMVREGIPLGELAPVYFGSPLAALEAAYSAGAVSVPAASPVELEPSTA